MLEWDLFGFPTDLFDGMQGDYSNPAAITSDGLKIQYVWHRSFLFETATLTMTVLPGRMPSEQRWNWTFSDNVHAGALVITYAGYLIQSFQDAWRTAGPLSPDAFTFTPIGEFGMCGYVGSEPYMRMTSTLWDQGPAGDRNP